MPSIMREVYYREPEIFVTGRYNRDISVEQVLAIKKVLVENFGALLSKITIDYSKRKDGIHVTPTVHKSIENVPFYFRHRDSMDDTHIFYSRTNKEDPKTVIVDKDGQITTR